MTPDFTTGLAGLRSHIGIAPGIDRLRKLRPEFNDAVIEAILTEAAQFSGDILAPFDRTSDHDGCRLVDGRVVLAPGHREAWAKYRDGGWIGLDIPEDYGGQGVPAIVAIAVQELFDRGSVSFGMAPGAARGAARLLLTHADPAIAAQWVPRLATGTWGATICISEPDAGSDVGRIRTVARRGADDIWRIEGEKIWISFGDHDLTERIGHMLLARPAGAPAGIRGLSLFLVPSVIDRPEGTARNNIVTRRVEEKLGLHGSPTCALGFENAEAVLIGTEGRGVAQLFRMIISMRLHTGTQGLGIATASYEAAQVYAQERRQGGRWDAPAVPILSHADVQLTLAAMASRIETLRGLVYTTAVAADLSDIEPEAAARASAASLLGWLLPIVKNSGAETAFNVAAEAILIFGGAGYTTEWPVERHLRDARVLAVYEGTTGMQAIDLVRRRWILPDTGYEAFIAAARGDLHAMAAATASALLTGLDMLEQATAWLRDPARDDWEIQAAARAALRLATEVAHGWIASRLATFAANTVDGPRLVAVAGYALSVMGERLPAALYAMRAGAGRTQAFPLLNAG